MKSVILAFAASSAAVLLGGCTSLPPTLAVPGDERLLFRAVAEGTWSYHCRLSNDGQSLAWALLQPDAVLRDPAGRDIGKLEAGPNFVHRDGSVAEGLLAARHSGQPAALPMALYRSSGAGTAGAMTPVRSIQQLSTRGGAQPSQGCTSGADIMSEQRVPFAAEFRFFGR